MRYNKSGMPTIGTAGHVDHGKSALIRALTGQDPDRLPEEHARGMSIDVGFAYLDLPNVGRVSIVDVPGHEKFATNMLVGALATDVALLCVAADEGVMPQTCEHLRILELLPVGPLLVALTRADLADPAARARADEQVRELLAPTRFRDAPRQFVSAHTGEGLGELKRLLAQALADPAPRPTGPWYLTIDRVFTVKGHGAVVTGSLVRGEVRVGERAVVMPGQLEARIRAIQSHSEALDVAEAGGRVALNLGGVRVGELRRGQMVGAPGAVVETQQFDARVRWLREVRYADRVRVAVGADEVMGRAMPNALDPGYVQFRLDRPVAIARGQPVLVRRYSPQEVWGGGEVVVPSAPRRRRSDPPPTWASDPQGTSGDEVIRRIRAASGGVPAGEIASSLGIGAESLAPELVRRKAAGELVEFGGLWFVPERFAECRDRFMRALRDLHEAEPARAFQPRDLVVRNAGLRWEGKPLDRICGYLAAEGALKVRGSAIALPDFQVRLKPRQRELLDRVVAKMAAAGLGAVGATDLARGLGVPPHAVREIWELGVECGELVRMPDGTVLTQSQIQRALEEIRKLAGAGPFTAAQVRDRLQSSRSRVIPLLEYLDAVGVTQRIGDRRVLREDPTARKEAGLSSEGSPVEAPESSRSA